MKIKIDGKKRLIRIEHPNNVSKIVVPDGVFSIGKSSFNLCPVKEIVISNTVKDIEEYAFANCNKLVTIKIPKYVQHIGHNAFYDCKSLKNISLENSPEVIESNTFFGCSSLEYFNIPHTVKVIEKGTFNGCSSLKSIVLPYELMELGAYSFSGCKSIKEIVIPNNITVIGDETFRSNESLEKIVLPPNLEKIGDMAFYNCKSLENIDFPGTLKEIGSKAFEGVPLRKLSLPSSIERLSYDAFSGSYYIKDFKFCEQDMTNVYTTLGYKNMMYFENLFLSDTTLDTKYIDMIDFSDRRDISSISNSIIMSTIFNKEDIKRRRELVGVLPFIAGLVIDKENYPTIKHELLDNSKEFSKLLKRISDTHSIYENYSTRLQYFDLYKLARSLGAFSDNQIERQKACEFIANIMEKDLIKFNYIHGSFDSMHFNRYNKDFAEFFMNSKNFEQLIDREKYSSGFMSRVYNEFNKVKEFGRSNRGSQRYRKVTVDMCIEFFNRSHFTGIDDTNRDIAKELGKYTRRQPALDEATEIRKEFLRLKEIGKIREHIVEDINDILNDLNEVSNSKLTSEFLAKSDPLNYTLGKYCFCCAHIEGAGSGIMKASILHPDCQNLVIRNEKGEIIAKSTLYINRTQGYGVFNNVEVSHMSEVDRDLIYLQYKKAVEAFAKRYNELNPTNPLTQINVGMNLNDLEQQINRKQVKSHEILKGLNFNIYGGYSGDWQQRQRVMWSSKEIKRKK